LLEISYITGGEYIEQQENKPIIFLSAHIGNWELASRLLLEVDPKTALIYRRANNPYVERLIQYQRGKYSKLIIQKGDKAGFREIVKHIKSGGSLGMLADQKMREGIEIDFFGKPAKVPVTAAELAIKFNLPIIMGRVIGKPGEKFELRFDPPIWAEGRSAAEVTKEIYKTYERWISEYPEQWFLMHNRWKK
jgi:KDO2-lipid IV(A) lauroyltransferase